MPDKVWETLAPRVVFQNLPRSKESRPIFVKNTDGLNQNFRSGLGICILRIAQGNPSDFSSWKACLPGSFGGVGEDPGNPLPSLHNETVAVKSSSSDCHRRSAEEKKWMRVCWGRPGGGTVQGVRWGRQRVLFCESEKRGSRVTTGGKYPINGCELFNTNRTSSILSVLHMSKAEGWRVEGQQLRWREPTPAKEGTSPSPPPPSSWLIIHLAGTRRRAGGVFSFMSIASHQRCDKRTPLVCTGSVLWLLYFVHVESIVLRNNTWARGLTHNHTINPCCVVQAVLLKL